MATDLNGLGQFWHDVASAYDLVCADHELEVRVARTNKEAKVSWVSMSENPAVVILVFDANTANKDPLISP